MSDAVLTLCRLCKPDALDHQVEALRAALVQAGLDVEVRGQDCLNACPKPQAMALQGSGRAVYVFDGVDPEADRDDILATLHSYLAARDGWIEDAETCGRLRFCLRSRVAAMDQSTVSATESATGVPATTSGR